jgi:hypothetical protein
MDHEHLYKIVHGVVELLDKGTSILDHVVVTLAAFCGGFWVLLRLKRERTDEAALNIVLSNTSSAMGSLNLVLFTVELANKGKTKIDAKTERDKDHWIFNDGPEKLPHACSLQIRQLNQAVTTPPVSLDWFESGPWVDMPLYRNQMAINVLLEYEAPETNEVEFWMEPGETYHLGVPVLLPAGTYFAKLTFVGADQEKDWLDKTLDKALEWISRSPPKKPHKDDNFWSQVYGFTVPSERKSQSTQPT